MKQILTISCLFLSLMLSAQISITSADMPTPGTMARSTLADSLTTLQANTSNTGANYNWDFSSLVPLFQRVDTFITAPLNYILSYPSATVSRRLPVQQGQSGPGGVTIQSGYEFFRTTSTRFERLGYGGTIQGSPLPLSLVNNPRDIVYRLPLQYDSKDTSYSEAELNIPNLAYVKQKQWRYNHVDGWGTITTPFGTFDCMRVKSRLVGEDSIVYNGFPFTQTRPTRFEYKWLANNEIVPVLQIITQAGPGGGTQINNQVQYRDTLRAVPMVGIAEEMAMYQNGQLCPRPNPASEQVLLEWEKQLGASSRIEIYDNGGRLLFEQDLAHQQQLSINVNTWESGVYQVRIYGDKQSYTGTFIVNKR